MSLLAFARSTPGDQPVDHSCIPNPFCQSWAVSLQMKDEATLYVSGVRTTHVFVIFCMRHHYRGDENRNTISEIIFFLAPVFVT